MGGIAKTGIFKIIGAPAYWSFFARPSEGCNGVREHPLFRWVSSSRRFGCFARASIAVAKGCVSDSRSWDSRKKRSSRLIKAWSRKIDPLPRDSSKPKRNWHSTKGRLPSSKRNLPELAEKRPKLGGASIGFLGSDSLVPWDGEAHRLSLNRTCLASDQRMAAG